MAIKITSANESIEVKNIKILIYGQPGVWKTSIAFTSESPLLLDFDQGSYRSEFRKDVVQIETWQDIAQMTEEDLKSYSTICVDTVGRLLDVMTSHIIKENPKLARSSGALTLQGYGELKANYAQWLKRLIGYGKDIVLIAHDREDKKGDDLIVRPDIQGGSYGEVFKQSDGIAYMYRTPKGIMLDFSPNDGVGKNVVNFSIMQVPNFHQQPKYLAEIIQQIKDAMNRLGTEGQKVKASIDEWRNKISELKTDKEINKIIPEIKKISDKSIQLQVKHILNNQAQQLELIYEGSKDSGKYVERAAA